MKSSKKTSSHLANACQAISVLCFYMAVFGLILLLPIKPEWRTVCFFSISTILGVLEIYLLFLRNLKPSHQKKKPRIANIVTAIHDVGKPRNSTKPQPGSESIANPNNITHRNKHIAPSICRNSDISKSNTYLNTKDVSNQPQSRRTPSCYLNYRNADIFPCKVVFVDRFSHPMVVSGQLAADRLVEVASAVALASS